MLVPFFLYAESHYRFRYFFSYLHKPEPEVIFDIPHRIDPGFPIPLLLVIKDADKYPSEIHRGVATISQGGRECFQEVLVETPLPFDQKLSWKRFDLAPRGLRGWIEVDIQFHLHRKGKTRSYRNDNYRTSSHQPLRVFLSNDPLPSLPDLVYGDVHTHSSYTDDQVEFGAPLEPSIALSRAMGLSFFCATDHSYDLDDRIDTYLENDASLPKWKAFQREVQDLNRSNQDFAVIPGEEVTCRNRKGQNVHLLLLGNAEYVPGSGDSAERWLRTRSEYSIADVLKTQKNETVSIAAHPRETVPFLQRLLLGRGRWAYDDLKADGLTGIQFANGVIRDGFDEGKRLWIRTLLEGRTLKIVAGNDSHGNFNRFRQIGLPFLRIVERSQQIFGKMRTGVVCADSLSKDGILAALKAGICFVTDGPACMISVTNEDGHKTEVGGTAVGRSLRCFIQARSTTEFGMLDRVVLFHGVIGNEREVVLWETKKNGTYRVDESIPLRESMEGYVRAEVYTRNGTALPHARHFAFTNPIWLMP